MYVEYKITHVYRFVEVACTRRTMISMMKRIKASTAEYDGCFEETPGNLSETLERSECAEGIGSTATNVLWTFGVVPVRFHPRTRILKATYSERRQSFAAIKKLGNEKRRVARKG